MFKEKTFIGERVKKYLIITCPKCGESYRIDCAEYSTKLWDTIHVQCPWCECEVDYWVAGSDVDNAYQIVKAD